MTVFSYLLFGQVIDNLKIHRQKLLFVVVEILIAFWFIITGWVSLLDLKLDDQKENPLSVVDKDYYSS